MTTKNKSGTGTGTERGIGWTFLTNHAHVLICLAEDPSARLRDVALRVGITERAVQRIVSELHDEEYISIHKEGRRNSYKINQKKKLRHPIEQSVSIKDLVGILAD
jgi:predicted transcriptional regulator